MAGETWRQSRRNSGKPLEKKKLLISEKKNHHADIYITWCEVKVDISSHDMGGVTTKCVNLAMDISFINK